MIIADSAIRVLAILLNDFPLPISVGNTVIFPPPGLYYLPAQPQMAWKRREFYCTALGHVYIG